jgi:DNA polymerase III delta subunit
MLRVIVGQKKRPKGAEELKWEHMGAEELSSLASTQALFGGKRVFVFTGALLGARGEEFLAFAKEFASSEHEFIFEEEKFLKRETDIVTKAGGKVDKVETLKKERGFDPFGLTYALGAKDKKKLWLAIMESLRAGEKPEAIAGLLAWKARQMKDIELSRELVVIYHDSHRGMGSLDLLLEKFALQL